jgi:dynein heavy chain
MPPPGKRLAIFVDDINMPAVEKYGAQPPIELLRQYVDYKGVYDRKALAWKDISESVLVVAAAPPGGGRSNLTPRFTRHFSLLNVPDSNQEVLSFIFSQIVKNFLHAK